MTRAPHLATLARQAAGDPEAALVLLLQLACEQVGMQVAVLGRISGGQHVVHLAVDADAGRLPHLEVSRPARESWCVHVQPDGPLVVRDAADRPDLAALPVSRELGVACYAGTLVRGVDGRELGVLGVAGTAPVTELDDRDLAALAALGEVVGELYPAFLRGAVPAPRRPAGLGALADAVSRAHDLESLTRPLLQTLHEVSGIASTYLTVVDQQAGVQEIRYARNAKDGFALPEGLQVPWEDTLCKRSLEEGRSCTTDVPEVWGDSAAARELGIVTYVSVPVRLSDGSLWGTLCGADDVAHHDAEQALTTLQLFATLIAGEVDRARATPPAAAPVPDALTGCAAAGTVEPWLAAALDARWSDEVVAVVRLDVDGFRQLNAQLGTAVGDALLVELAARVRAAAGPADLVARAGGDELVVASRLLRSAADRLLWTLRSASRFRLGTPAGPVEVRCSVGLAVSGPETAPAALLAASTQALHRDRPLAG